MSKIIFFYGRNKSEMKTENTSQNKNSLDKILLQYLSMIDKKKEDVLYLYKGKILDMENKDVNDIIKKQKTIRINVINLNTKNVIKEPNYIICPECHNLQLV